MFSTYRFQTMIRDIDPLLTKQSTIDAFKSLPTVNVVLNAVKDVANGTTIDEMGNSSFITISPHLKLRNAVPYKNHVDKYLKIKKS